MSDFSETLTRLMDDRGVGVRPLTRAVYADPGRPRRTAPNSRRLPRGSRVASAARGCRSSCRGPVVPVLPSRFPTTVALGAAGGGVGARPKVAYARDLRRRLARCYGSGDPHVESFEEESRGLLGS
ncbi:MAG TPA: hypothetical protein VG142_14710 [Trebonia sp.]|jgi:hypothetical protein|nr:hypothetical protein [Trebonia sp.]